MHLACFGKRTDFRAWTPGLLSTLVATALLAAVPAPVQANVRDEAHLFQPNTVEKANALIREIWQRDGKDLLVETLAEPPAGKMDEATSADPKVKDRFFKNWALTRAREAHVNGVYVLICKEPGHVEIEVGDDTRRRAFSDEDRRRLTQIFIDHFRKKEFDTGLLQGVQFVHDTLDRNLSHGRAAAPRRDEGQPRGGGQPSGLGGWLCFGLMGLGAILLVVALFRAIGGGGRGYGGGGFLSSMLGGLFGAAAGMWIYDTFLGGHSARGGDVFGSGGGGVDQDYSGGGADFGGGDYGSSGGDLGGGGGDFGSSGGDF
jgi:uncharacterized protein